jgi:hypothetical protein
MIWLVNESGALPIGKGVAALFLIIISPDILVKSITI